MVSAWFLVVICLNICHLVLSQEKRYLGVPSVASIHVLSIEKTRDIVSEHMQLVEPAEETFSCWYIVDVSQTKNVLVFIVLESLSIDIQKEI